jgi:hypothetical protein
MSQSTVDMLNGYLERAIERGDMDMVEQLTNSIARLTGSAYVAQGHANDNDSADTHDVTSWEVGQSHTFKNEKNGEFKEFKRRLRMNLIGNRPHDSKERVTLWTQRRKGKQRLAQRAELKHGAQFQFSYSDDYKTVTVERVR